MYNIFKARVFSFLGEVFVIKKKWYWIRHSKSFQPLTTHGILNSFQCCQWHLLLCSVISTKKSICSLNLSV
jgi:hypothetical protein